LLHLCTLLAAGASVVKINDFIFGHRSDLRTSLMRIAIAIALGFIIPFTAGFISGVIGSRRKSRRKSPRNARFLIILLMANPSGDALLGDLEDRFDAIANDSTLGPDRAHFWYWFQVVISLRPLAWGGLKRLSGLAALYEAIRNVIK
jgi:hypothetical protein